MFLIKLRVQFIFLFLQHLIFFLNHTCFQDFFYVFLKKMLKLEFDYFNEVSYLEKSKKMNVV